MAGDRFLAHALWPVTLALLLGARAAAQTPAAPAPLTLEAAQALAMAANPTIAAARLQRAVDEAGVSVAGERPNPEANFETSRDTPRQAFSLSFPLEFGGKRDRRIDLASAAVKTGEAELDRVIAGVKNDVRRAYFELVAAGRRVALETESRDLAQRIRDTAQTRVQFGDAPQFDVVRADVDLSLAENDLTGAEGDLSAATIELNTLLGRPADAALTPAGDLAAAPLPPLAALLARAATENADLHVLDLSIAEQTARRNVARTLRTPDVSLGGGVTYDAQPDFTVGWRGQVTLTLPLFTKHEGEVAVEDAELVRLGGERAALTAEISGAVAAAYARAAAARKQAAQFDGAILPNAIKAEQMAEDAYTSGQTGLLELLDARQTLRDVRTSSLDAGLHYQQALADLERALGTSFQ